MKSPIIEKQLDSLEAEIGLKTLADEESFNSLLMLDNAIVYLLVDWSGPERMSRHIVYTALNELNNVQIPLVKIDCSDQQTNLYVVEWLKGQGGRDKMYYGGWGETLFVMKGILIDFIANPAKIGLENTKEQLKIWQVLNSKN